MGAGKHGGFGNTYGKAHGPAKEQKESNPAILPKDKSQLRHIFSGKTGHLTDTPYHRRQLRELANTKKYYKGTDKYGNRWNAKIMRDGSQLWVRYRKGVINEGGRNQKPRSWDNETGLNANPFKKEKGESK